MSLMYQGWDPDIVKYCETIVANCKLLTAGYTEKVEYTVEVLYHTQECLAKCREVMEPGGKLKRIECDCPVKPEKRTRQAHRHGLLRQLKDYAENRDCNLNPQAARGAPRVKKAKLNPELNGFLTLNEIHCDVYMSLDRMFEEIGRDRTWLSMKLEHLLPNLITQARDMYHHDGQRDHIEKMARLTDKWVAMARRTLNHTVDETMFADVVCGDCGGGLAAPARIQSIGDKVRCVGTPTTPPCGRVYLASEWLALLEGGQA